MHAADSGGSKNIIGALASGVSFTLQGAIFPVRELRSASHPPLTGIRCSPLTIASQPLVPAASVMLRAQAERRAEDGHSIIPKLGRSPIAATLLSIHDPANVRCAKDLLGHASFGTTEAHYIMGQSRMAGRVVARIVDALRK
jgi:hypothetical protein